MWYFDNLVEVYNYNMAQHHVIVNISIIATAPVAMAMTYPIQLYLTACKML